MDTRSLIKYKDGLRDGKEKVYSVRVMVVGHYGVGKTTLTKRLLGKEVMISDKNSTEGIDIHTECCKVTMATGEWIAQEKIAEQFSRLQRLVKFLNERVQKQELNGEREGQSELDNMFASVANDDGHSHHDQQVSVEIDINQEVRSIFSEAVELPIVAMVTEASTESNENEKDAVMEILQIVNENSDKLEKSMVFLTSRAIYLLVIGLSQQVTDLIKDDKCFLDMKGIELHKVHDLVEIWLNSIHSCASSPEDGIPPVILVGTHVDKIPEEDHYYLVPCILRQTTPETIICPESDPEMESTSVLCFVCIGKFLPSPIFHRLVGACLTHWAIARQQSENLIYCGCCVFDLDHYHRLTLYFREYAIFARVTRLAVTDTCESSNLCSQARMIIFNNLNKIIGILGETLVFELYIQCPDFDTGSLEGLIPLPPTQKKEKVVCHSHVKSHTMVSRELCKFWFEEEFSAKEKPGDAISTLSIESFTSVDSKEPVSLATGNTIRQLSEHIAAPKSKFEQKMDSVELLYSRVSDLTISKERQRPLQRRALPPGKKYHAFFSYSSSDMQWVKETVEILEREHGFVCC